ncbi:MAG: site-specific integrase [Solirubrobacteraceae bacterium]
MSTTKRKPQRQGIESRRTIDNREQFRGTAYDRRTGRKLRGPWTYSLSEARSWRIDTLAQLQSGARPAERGPTLRDAAATFLAGIESGAIYNCKGAAYKPSVQRDYRRDLDKRIVPLIGGSRLNELTLPDIQRVADRLATDGLAPASVRNSIMALRALYAWALPRGFAHGNPCVGLRLASAEKGRDRIASASECALLIAALPPRDRATLGLATYAGLRAGELLALDWSAIDLDRGMVRIERAWDHGSRTFIAPKSKAAARDVPIVARLRLLLEDHRELTAGAGLLFGGRDPRRPMNHSALLRRMKRSWSASGLEPLGLHEARHTYASMMIAAGANAKALCTYMGHGSIAITYDRYGHLFPGSEVEVRALLDAYLEGGQDA